MKPKTRRRGQGRGQKTPTRKTRRLGFGEFTYEGPNPLARMWYLFAVSKCVPEALEALAALDDETAIDEWAASWGFTDSWALSSARSARLHWREHPDRIGYWLIVSGEAVWAPIFPAPPAWNPILQTENEYRLRSDEYIDGIKRTPGLKPAPEKRGQASLHFEWLALHHVAGLRLADISERYQTERQTIEIASISEAINTTAEMIGLTPRLKHGRKG